MGNPETSQLPRDAFHLNGGPEILIPFTPETELSEQGAFALQLFSECPGGHAINMLRFYQSLSADDPRRAETELTIVESFNRQYALKYPTEG